nr:Nif11 family protein [Lysinibacillus sphaericus]
MILTLFNVKDFYSCHDFHKIDFVRKIKQLKGGLTLSIQFLQQLTQSSDKEIVAIARSEGFEITTSEVKKLRPYLEQFSFSWLFLGIPKDILVEVEAVLGRKRSRQLIALFTK